MLKRDLHDACWNDWQAFGNFLKEEELEALRDRWQTPLDLLLEISANAEQNEELLLSIFKQILEDTSETLLKRFEGVMFYTAEKKKFIKLDSEGTVIDRPAFDQTWMSWSTILRGMPEDAVEKLEEAFTTPTKVLTSFANRPKFTLQSLKDTFSQIEELDSETADILFGEISEKASKYNFLSPEQKVIESKQKT
ncbi:MAG: hypothetical protein EZS28_040701 [Streblomastix strix]|uniref:Uncharacterized protein n=1 Tax=Streblomastix strix TaxID=222440 RepID=A0A5J4U1C5_9EUKA|nr:MAG: hypothetical protein EZS28_040701 [Streblomastix strix]